MAVPAKVTGAFQIDAPGGSDSLSGLFGLPEGGFSAVWELRSWSSPNVQSTTTNVQRFEGIGKSSQSTIGLTTNDFSWAEVDARADGSLAILRHGSGSPIAPGSETLTETDSVGILTNAGQFSTLRSYSLSFPFGAIAPSDTSAALSADGSIAIFHYVSDGATARSGWMGRLDILNVDGTSRYSDIPIAQHTVNRDTSSSYDKVLSFFSEITALADGRFLVTWNELHYSGSNENYRPPV
jgi:hypothetical protein